MTDMTQHMKYMRMALRLAEKAKGRTSPNPMVGALVVKNGKVVSRGFHEKAGMPHAEAVAIHKAGAAAKGSTLYVTLEPCSHTNKRTPPCCPLVIEKGIQRVVVAMIDPNPHVSGNGIKKLRSAGVEVISGVLEDGSEKAERGLHQARYDRETLRDPQDSSDPGRQDRDGFRGIAMDHRGTGPARRASPAELQ